MTTPQTKTAHQIKINSNSPFFVSICKDKTSMHSYIHLATVQTDGIKVLAAYGKNKLPRGVTLQSSDCEIIFSKTPAVILDEPIMHRNENPRRTEVSYKAFENSYQAYLHYIKKLIYLSEEQKKKGINPRYLSAYVPIIPDGKAVQGQDEVILERRFLTYAMLNDIQQAIVSLGKPIPMDSQKPFNPGYCQLSQRDTCRTTAIDMAQEVAMLDNLGKGVSGLFFRKLPLSMTIVNGVIKPDQLFILPPPPNAFKEMAPENLLIAKRLYRRLDEIIQIEKKNPLTQQKFEAIKKLYKETTENYACDHSQLMKHIEKWHSDNQELLGSHRKAHWFRFQTASTKMFNEILAENKSTRPN